MEALLNLQAMTPHQRGAPLADTSGIIFQSLLVHILYGAIVRHFYRKCCPLSRKFFSLWLGFRKKAMNYSFVCFCDGLL